MKQLFVLAIFSIAFLYGKAQEVTIIAETHNFKTGDLVLKTPGKNYNLVIKNNQFKVTVPLKEKMEVFALQNLKNRTGKYIYVEPGVMKGKVYKKGFLKQTTFSGSKNQDLRNDLYKYYKTKEKDKVYQLLSQHTDMYAAIAFMHRYKEKLNPDKLKKILEEVKAPFLNEAKEIKIYLDTKNIKKMKVGSKAYDFEWKEGDKKVKLSDFRGKYVMLNLTSSSCSYCWRTYEDMNKLEDNYKTKLKIISVHIWGDTKKYWEKMKKGMKERNPNQAIFKGTTPWGTKLQTEIEHIYYSNTLPTFILINKEGVITNWWKGHLPMKKVLKRIQK